MQRSDFALSPAQRADAREALRLLTGSGLSLVDAAKRALYQKRAIKRISVESCADLFLRAKLTAGKRAATVRWYEENLSRIVTEFGARDLDSVSRADFRTWLAELPTRKGNDGRATRAALARCGRALWRWAAAQEPPMAGTDPTGGLEFSAPASAKTRGGVLTVAECRQILLGAGRHRAALALAIFAGVRPEELAGKNKPWLRWEHVNTEEHWIIVPEGIAKTGKKRAIEGLPSPLWAWLHAEPLRDNVSPVNWRTLQETAKKLCGRKEWPHDALRHTAASYLLAHTQDAGKVANWLGHEDSPRMLHTKYFGLVRQAEAQEWIALVPPFIPEAPTP